jgi:hypothetical protein
MEICQMIVRSCLGKTDTTDKEVKTQGKRPTRNIDHLLSQWSKFSDTSLEKKEKGIESKETCAVTEEKHKQCATNELLFVKTLQLTNDSKSFENGTAFRDLYFLKHLSEQASSLSPLIHSLGYDSESDCIQIYMERFELDMDQYMVQYAKNFYRKTKIAKEFRFTRIIPDFLLKKMFAIVLDLDREKIVHGDLKPDQFLYSTLTTRMVLTDYGFAGFLAEHPNQDDALLHPILGWPVFHESLGVQTFTHYKNEAEPLDAKHAFATQHLLPYLNRWQFDMIFWILQVGIYNSVTKELQPYGALSEQFLSVDISKQFQSFCHGNCAPLLKTRYEKMQAISYVLKNCGE